MFSSYLLPKVNDLVATATILVVGPRSGDSEQRSLRPVTYTRDIRFVLFLCTSAISWSEASIFSFTQLIALVQRCRRKEQACRFSKIASRNVVIVFTHVTSWSTYPTARGNGSASRSRTRIDKNINNSAYTRRSDLRSKPLERQKYCAFDGREIIFRWIKDQLARLCKYLCKCKRHRFLCLH